MDGIENNLNRDKILKINDQITELALRTNFDDPQDKKRASDEFKRLVNERKALYEAGSVDEEESVAG